ncbi:cell division protein SepF [Actinospica durhamensis]|uniref:Cell division protein SepF n=1 Tax=Actinospica durhamensis TaxID=1508375 RepID=A0A941ETE4_9ACTN|nr:cell division protein SepF [Actinospica durhamensis]MBR7837752.1 cell division protein SepF [Actinospica durhamensis]
MVRDGEAHTAFTGRLIELLRKGDDRAGDLLTLGDVYRSLHLRLRADGLPLPQQRGTATADLLGLVRNGQPALLEPAALTEEMAALLASGSPRGRLAGVEELGEWLIGTDPRCVLAARLALEEVAARDNPQVAAAARGLLSTVTASPAQPAPLPAHVATEDAEAEPFSDVLVEDDRTAHVIVQALIDRKVKLFSPRTYNEARVFGEAYRNGEIVAVHFYNMESSDVQRIYDFSSGLSAAVDGKVVELTLDPPMSIVTSRSVGWPQ